MTDPLDPTSPTPLATFVPWWQPTPIWSSLIAELGDPR